MALKNRTPLQVSPEFKKKLEEIQKKIMMSQGEKRSLREITYVIMLFKIKEIERLMGKGFSEDEAIRRTSR